VDNPKIPEVLSTSSFSYTLENLNDHRAKYEKAITDKDFELARYFRDTMINSIRRDIDSFYHLYEVSLGRGRRNFATFADVLAVAGVTATTITNGERVKTVISSLVSFVQGSQGRIDQNIFRDKTVDVIIQKMRAGRTRIDAAIMDKMANLDATRYVFTEAETDLRELFWAGTLQSGFLELASLAGNDAKDANAEHKRVTEDRIKIPDVTTEQLDLTFRIQSRRETLEATWLADRDGEKSKNAVMEARRILDELQSPAPADASPRAVFRLLRARIAELLKDTAQIERIAEAMKIKQDQ
jgi:hypothetical protein